MNNGQVQLDSKQKLPISIGSVEYKCKAYSVIVCIFYKETHT